ncbi:MAG TPA: asparaginase [Blastocatellia bacterium]|nr:asparaginase [Blastocatellia bacterium]
MNNSLPILVEVTRGSIIESWHRGAIVAVTPDGKTVAGVGDETIVTSTRSTIKPIQTIPFIASGAADHFNCTAREIAVASASHQGEPVHTQTVAAMLAKGGLDESALACGPQPPYSAEATRELERLGLPHTQLHNNCSGKHAGMLLTALHRRLGVDGYYLPEHGVQRSIVEVFSALAGLDPHGIPTATDGCSAPTFGVPLKAMALSFARLANPEAANTIDENQRAAINRIVAAMIDYPEMIGGTRDRLDSDLLRAAKGKLICKIGAEAVYGIGVLPCETHSTGLGIAMKIEDGATRGLGAVVVETLSQLGVLDAAQTRELATYHHPQIDNRRGIAVGDIRAIFKL